MKIQTAFKALAVGAALILSQSAGAETIVCTGVLGTSDAVVNIPRDHAPLDIDAPADNFFNGPTVVENGQYKVTAKRSINPTADVVLEVWQSNRRVSWAAGVNHVGLGLNFDDNTDGDFMNVNCYTTPTWQAMNAQLCAGETTGQLKNYCDGLRENPERNFPAVP